MTAHARPGPAVVLLSGGLDSAVVLAIAREAGHTTHALSFDYGQRHRHELAAAAKVARSLGANTHTILPVSLKPIGGSALTNDDIPVPKDNPATPTALGGIPITYVPARNMVFLSLAAAYAEVIGARDIYLGVNAVDYSGYPDCRPEFIAAMQSAVNLATRQGVSRPADQGPHFILHAPIITLAKHQIITRGHQLGVDFALTHSCYDPVQPTDTLAPSTTPTTQRACGRCDSCTIRRQGFAHANISDPTPYA